MANKMHSLVILVVLIACGANGSSLSKADVEEMLEKFILGCAALEGASADEIGFIREYGLPQNKPQKCAIACVGESFGIVKNGNILIDSVMHLATRILSDEPNKIEIIRNIAEVCHDGHDPDRCEASTNTYLCAIAESKKANFNLKDFI